MYYAQAKNNFMSDNNRVFIFDTTMRDGEQSPGASMSLEEKIQIARVFDELQINKGRLLLFHIRFLLNVQDLLVQP